MSKALPRMRMKLLACVFMAWPVSASSQTPAVQQRAASGASASIRTIPDEAFQRWAREDARLIEGILGSLAHIDLLLGDIERMIRQIPDVAARPTPPPAPVVIEKTVIQEVEVPGPLGGWATTLAGAALLSLLAFWLGRKQSGAPRAASAPARTPAPTSPVEAAPPPEPSRPSPAEAEPRPAPPGATAIEPPASIEPVPATSGDQALELAEIMFSMGLGQGATQTLIEQIRNEPKLALRHWLKLLEIYRRNGQQEEFERSAEELRLHFNVRPEDWQAQPGETRTIENFPHIARRLTELWGTPDCLVYMRNLLDDNRGEARSGFPQSVAEELLLLTSVMREAYGFLPG